MKFEVNKIDGSISFEAEIECSEDESYGVKLGLAIHWGYKNGKSLENGNYTNAILKNLTFDGSRFDGSRFDGSRFDGSRFDGSTFDGSRFVGSTFDGSTFDGSRFVGSTFDGSRFDGSRFDGSTFVGSTFVGSTFDESALRNFKHDFWGILLRFKNEVPELIRYLKEGKIDGSVYSGECSCLMGTFANIKHCNIDDEEFKIKDTNSPAEQWFMMIKQGDTPENNFAAMMALQWAEEFLLLLEK